MRQTEMLRKLTEFQLEIERAHAAIADGDYAKSQESRKRAAEIRTELAAFIVEFA